MASLASCRAVAQRPALASMAAQQRGRGRRVAAQYTPEQIAFLDRKARESRSPAPAQETRGRSPVTRRPATASPAAAKWDHATRVMPAGAAPPTTPAGFNASLAQDAGAASGLSAEQAAFVQRKAAEQASASSSAANPVPYSQRKPIAQPGLVGSLAKQPPASPSPRPSFRPTSRQPAPAAAKWDHATRVMPAGAAPPTTPAGFDANLAQNGAATSGLSAEQAAFVQRKAAEVRPPPPPTPLRGRSAAPRPTTASPAAAKWDHATRVMPAGAAPPTTPAGFDASLAQDAGAASGLSAEQAAFVQRKAAEQASASSGAANPVPYSQRKPIAQPGLVGSLAKQPPSVAPASPSPRPSFRPTLRQASPAAAKWDHATRVMPAGAAPPTTPAGFDAKLAQDAGAAGLSPEQAAFVQRKAAEQASAGSSSGAANPVPYAQRKPIAQPGLVGSLARQPPSVAPSSPSPRPSFRPSPRQASPAAAKWDHATRVMPAGSPPPVTPARYVHVTPEEAALLSKEQAEFLERKRAGEK